MWWSRPWWRRARRHRGWGCGSPTSTWPCPRRTRRWSTTTRLPRHLQRRAATARASSRRTGSGQRSPRRWCSSTRWPAGSAWTSRPGGCRSTATARALFFVVARADCAGEDLFGNYEPSPEVRRMFVPFAPSGDPPCLMAMFQVTFLKCGGVVLGTGIHHVAMDGTGAFHFIQTWTGLARGLSVSEVCPSPPFHDRTLLRARSPLRADFDHPVYSPAYLNGRPRPFVTRVYSVSPKLLARLKSECAPGVSIYGAVTAHLWRSMYVARGLTPGSDTRLRVPANVRHRLHPQLPRQFFGNAIVRDLVTVKVGDVLAQPLGFVADTIRKAVEHVDDAVGDRLLGAGVREGQPGSTRAAHVGVRLVGGELVGDAYVRR